MQDNCSWYNTLAVHTTTTKTKTPHRQLDGLTALEAYTTLLGDPWVRRPLVPRWRDAGLVRNGLAVTLTAASLNRRRALDESLRLRLDEDLGVRRDEEEPDPPREFRAAKASAARAILPLELPWRTIFTALPVPELCRLGTGGGVGGCAGRPCPPRLDLLLPLCPRSASSCASASSSSSSNSGVIVNNRAA